MQIAHERWLLIAGRAGCTLPHIPRYMKTFLVTALALLAFASAHAADLPDQDELKELTDKTLLSFNKCVQKGDFTAFYKETATVWQKQTSPDKLKELFKQYAEQKIDIASAIREMEPHFQPKPRINKTGDFDVLDVKGYYDTKPSRISFELKYIEEDEAWKPVGIDVDIKAAHE